MNKIQLFGGVALNLVLGILITVLSHLVLILVVPALEGYLTSLNVKIYFTGSLISLVGWIGALSTGGITGISLFFYKFYVIKFPHFARGMAVGGFVSFFLLIVYLWLFYGIGSQGF